MSSKPEKSVTPDRRVRRTRRQLRDALVGLVLERGWDEVSVSDVCARADVGRSTFYVHFADKEDLLLSGFDELHARLSAVGSTAAGSFAFVDALVEHARENLRLFRALVGRRSGQEVQRRFRDVLTALVEGELAALGLSAEDRPVVARYVSGGFVEMLTAWLDRPARMDGAALAGAFRRLTAGVLAASGGAGAHPPQG